MGWYSHLFKNFPHFVVIHIVKGFGVVNKVKWLFFWHSHFFNGPKDVGNLISDSSVFSKSSLYIFKFSVHVLLKPSLKDFEHNFTSMWNEHNCTVVWKLFSITLLWDWNEHFTVCFPRLWKLYLWLLHHFPCYYIDVTTQVTTSKLLTVITTSEKKMNLTYYLYDIIFVNWDSGYNE